MTQHHPKPGACHWPRALGSTGSPVPAPPPRTFFLKGNVWVHFLSRCWNLLGPGCCGALRWQPLPFPPRPAPRCCGERALVPVAQPFSAASPCKEQGAGAPYAHPLCPPYGGVPSISVGNTGEQWRVTPPSGLRDGRYLLAVPQWQSFIVGTEKHLGDLMAPSWFGICSSAPEPCLPVSGLQAEPVRGEGSVRMPVLGRVSCRQHPTLPGTPGMAPLSLGASPRAAEPLAPRLGPSAPTEAKPQGSAGLL